MKLMKHPKPFLRRDLNSVTGMGLPDWSAGPKGDFGAIIEAAKTAGYAGVQHYFPEHVLAAGLKATGMGRVLTPENAASIARQHHELGLDATTLHVGTGLETDLEMDRLVGAVLEASAQHDYPLYIETHRATITQDIRRTVDMVGRFPEVRFNADLSHYYCGHEMTYGDIEAKFDFLMPIFERVRFLHGRIADACHAQVSIAPGDQRPFVVHFREMWRRCFTAFKAASDHKNVLIFAIELLPYKVPFGGQTHWLYYAHQAQSDGTGGDAYDRWTQADLLWQIASEEFEAA
ncbi:MAG TPA: hypothetical protein DIU09_08735 [Hyphomonadaceae bacterium]|jgi:hypothetical protein|nr:hypothetical protein AEM38_05830 [Hyphomonadaceae bacterium UKL13-1]HCP64660.1 hypothetical protein [Hyphomonadaceae bacterium]